MVKLHFRCYTLVNHKRRGGIFLNTRAYLNDIMHIIMKNFQSFFIFFESDIFAILKNAENFFTADLNYSNVPFSHIFPLYRFLDIKYVLTRISFFISTPEMEFLKLSINHFVSYKIGRLIISKGHNIPDVVIRSPAYTAIGSLFKHIHPLSCVINHQWHMIYYGLLIYRYIA